MNKAVKKFPVDAEYFFKEGCYVTEISNSNEDETVSITHARVETGTSTKWHSLNNTIERYVIQQGQGKVMPG